ncbi:MAG TPA: hypothetical protein VMX18_03365 [Candidatus Bipolaricaulota bacterium]|nr:hypothetical protein [Candidatus Bipolaricaulota bacterium]
MKFYFDKVDNLAGFSTKNVKDGEVAEILIRAKLTSDEPVFYKYMDQISNLFLSRAGVLEDSVCQFLIVIHDDLSADLYVNDFKVLVEIKAKRDVKVGEAITDADVADIRKIKFGDISIVSNDSVIYCFKVGWRFGLFFDFTAVDFHTGDHQQLDMEKMELSIGGLYRYLSFYHVYKTLEAGAQFADMRKDGWFPFIEIIAIAYKQLTEVYQNRFDFENRIKIIVDSFDSSRIKKITEKWWQNKIFSEKKALIGAGVNAYMQNNPDGFVTCIKTLWSEIEGVLRILYFVDTGKGVGIKSYELSKHIVEKAKNKTGSDHSLLFPLPFLTYLKDVVFATFNVEAGNIGMSRNSAGHGVAEPQQYTKQRALQLILILDQLFFYS